MDVTTLEVGWWAAVTVKQRVFPARCYVGEIKAFDELGIRLALVDWEVDSGTAYDLFVPWTNFEGAYVATDRREVEEFLGHARDWQEAIQTSAPTRRALEDRQTGEEFGPESEGRKR